MRALIISLLGVICLAAPASAGEWTRELRGSLDGAPVRITVDLFSFEARLRYAKGSAIEFRALPGRDTLTFSHSRSGRSLAFRVDRRSRFVRGAIVDTRHKRSVGWFREVLDKRLQPGAAELRGSFAERLADVMARMERHRAMIGERLLDLDSDLDRELDRLRVERRHDPRVLELSTAAVGAHAARRRAMLDSIYDPSKCDPREVHGPNRPSLNRLVAHRDLLTLLAQVRLTARPEELPQIDAARATWRKQIRRELKLWRAGGKELAKVLSAKKACRARKRSGGAKGQIARASGARRKAARKSAAKAPETTAALPPSTEPAAPELPQAKREPTGVSGNIFGRLRQNRLQSQARARSREIVSPRR